FLIWLCVPCRTTAPWLFRRYSVPRRLRSFPTRRSSDLRAVPALRRVLLDEGVDDRPAGIVDREPFHRNDIAAIELRDGADAGQQDRKSTRLNSSHVKISYAVFCLNKKRHATTPLRPLSL